LALRKIPARRQVSIPIEHRLDFLVDEGLVIELKAVDQLHRVHMAQVFSYLKAGGFRLGLLINFNVPSLRQGIRRVVWDSRAEPEMEPQRTDEGQTKIGTRSEGRGSSAT